MLGRGNRVCSFRYINTDYDKFLQIKPKVDYPEIVDGIEPKHRFMSAYEQHIEPPDRKWQYLLFAAEPYETISFKLPSREIDKVSVTL